MYAIAVLTPLRRCAGVQDIVSKNVFAVAVALQVLTADARICS